MKSIFRGFDDALPSTVLLLMQYGVVGFPILGVIVALALVLEHRYRNRQWVQLVMIGMAAITIFFSARTLLCGPSFVGPTIHSKQR